LTTQSVATGAQKYSIRTEDVWLADNVGPVRIDRAVNVDGVLWGIQAAVTKFKEREKKAQRPK